MGKEEMTSKVAERSPWLPEHFSEWILLKSLVLWPLGNKIKVAPSTVELLVFKKHILYPEHTSWPSLQLLPYQPINQ